MLERGLEESSIHYEAISDRPSRTVRCDEILTPNPRFPHPGFELLRTIVQEETRTLRAFDPESGLLLVSAGVEAVARRWRCSPRTVRRRIADSGGRSKDVVYRIRRRMTAAGLTIAVPTSVVSRWLGFSSPGAYRRWVRTNLAGSLRDLRRVVRKCPEFLAPGN